MKKSILLVIGCLLATWVGAQETPTALRVYEIFQNKCVNCHSQSNPRAGLDLEGKGSSINEKASDVYNKLVSVSSKNNTAKHKGYQLVYPGRVDKSFLFKKINQGLDKDMELEDGEKAPMPMSSSLTNVEKELIRQWILFGAPKDKIVVKEALLVDYYENNRGQSAFPTGAPPPPDPSEGFQIKMGPFFIDPAGEDEYYTKFQLDNETALEVNRLDIKMSNFSHHFIIYDYDSEAKTVPPGFRRSQDHTQDVSFVATVQENSDLVLPTKTAFKWDKNHVLDLNSHTVNYTNDYVYQNEVYVNVYTQPVGTAVQEMESTLVPYPFIFIPNNGNLITHTAQVKFPAELFVWSIAGHTHRYGQGYKIWANEETGAKGEILYDASCPRGIPGCVAPRFDYQHIPNRDFEDFQAIDFSKGVTHEARWINDGPKSVRWGPTSEDEMMLFAMLFVRDTTGLGTNQLTTSTVEQQNPLTAVKVVPNPMMDRAEIQLPKNIGTVQFRLSNMTGKTVRQLSNFSGETIIIQRDNLTKGMYLFTINTADGYFFTGKILIH
ncbi:MAG: T9SS type A sorting domain-containing protein [Bacteroidota bacterium]